MLVELEGGEVGGGFGGVGGWLGDERFFGEGFFGAGFFGSSCRGGRGNW